MTQVPPTSHGLVAPVAVSNLAPGTATTFLGGTVPSYLSPRDQLLLDALGLVAQSFGDGVPNSSVTPGSNGMRFAGVPLMAGQTVTNLTVGVATAGASMTHAQLALYDRDGATLLAQSADSPATFQGAGLKTLPMSAAFPVVTSGLYYAAYVGSFTGSGPALSCISLLTTANALAAIGAGQIRGGFGTGNAGLAPNPAAITAAGANSLLWVAVS